MRLLVCIDTWGLIGGSERYAMALAEGLAARGHALAVLCGARVDGADGALPVDVVPAWSDPRADAGALAAIAARARAAQPDATLVLSARSPRAFAALASARPRAPLVRFVQDHVPFCPGLDKMWADGRACTRPMGAACLERFVLGGGCVGFRREHHAAPLRGALGGLWRHLRAFEDLRRAERLVVFSQHMRRELLAAGADPERVALLRYFTRSGGAPAPLDALPEATRAFVAPAGPPLVLTPARLALPDKGVDVLLTALRKLRAPFRAVVAGAGPAEAWLREKARAEGLAGRVHFAGWLAAPALEALYARCDLVAVPSVWDEPFGLVGLEAMAHARPVAAFAVGGIPEWLDDGRTGLLAPRGDSDALAARIDALLGDAALRARLGAGGRARLERDFAPEVQLDALESLLAAAAAAR